jgi:hypothetical protein
MSIEHLTKNFLEDKRRDWHKDNPGQPTTKRAFADWLGVSEWVYSDYTTDIPRPPTRKQLKRIARRYPEIYDAIGVPEWRERTPENVHAEDEETVAELVASMNPDQRKRWEELKAEVDAHKHKQESGQDNFLGSFA